MNSSQKASSILAHRREENLIQMQKRIDEVYNKIPEMRGLDRNIKELGANIVRLGLLGNETSTLEDKLLMLRDYKRNLLRDNGYPSDYMELRYHHPVCKDTGFVGKSLCSCRKQLIIDENYNQSNIKNLLNYENFDRFNLNLFSDNPLPGFGNLTPRENMAKIVSYTKRYIDNFDNETKNLYIFGDVGRGKTFLINSIAKELLDRNYSVLYMTASSLFSFLKDYSWAFENDREKHEDQYQYILNADMLIIDDLGSEADMKNDEAHFFNVVNNRMISHKPIIFSSNFDEAGLADIYGDRIFSRIVGNSYVYEIIGEDLRLKTNR